jgi:hypothetical protein
MAFLWLSSSSLYYMISYQLKYIEGDMYINGITSSMSELAADMLSGYLAHKIGIKFTMILSYVIALVGMVCLVTFQPET